MVTTVFYNTEISLINPSKRLIPHKTPTVLLHVVRSSRVATILFTYHYTNIYNNNSKKKKCLYWLNMNGGGMN